MPTTAGKRESVLSDNIWWGYPDSVLPPMVDMPFGDDWAAASGADWELVDGTTNGLVVTHRHPKVAYRTEEGGRIANLLGDDDGVSIGFEDRTPTFKLSQRLSHLTKNVVASVNEVRALTITAAGAITAGSVTVVLNDVAFVVTGILATDTVAQIAAKVAAFSYAGWIAVQGTGADVNKVTFTALGVPFYRNKAYSYLPGTTGTTGAIARVKMGASPHNTYHHDPTAANYVMLGWEGEAVAGGLFPVGTRLRSVAYFADQTANVMHNYRRRGADSPFRITAALECMPYTVTDLMLQTSQLQRATLGRDMKMTLVEVATGT